MSISKNRMIIAIRVYPNASRSEIMGWVGDVLRINIAAIPEKGKANKELVNFLSDKLSMRKDQVSIAKGHASRNKTIIIDGLSQTEVAERIA